MRTIAPFKIGDLVYVTNSQGILTRESTVAEISPAGKVVKLATGHKYNADGSRTRLGYFLHPYDEERVRHLRDEAEAIRLRAALANINFRRLPLSALRPIALIVAEHKDAL